MLQKQTIMQIAIKRNDLIILIILVEIKWCEPGGMAHRKSISHRRKIRRCSRAMIVSATHRLSTFVERAYLAQLRGRPRRSAEPRVGNLVCLYLKMLLIAA